MKEFKIKLNIINFEQYKNITDDFHKLGYLYYIDFTFHTLYGATKHYLIINNPKMLQDQKLKELLVEHLI